MTEPRDPFERQPEHVVDGASAQGLWGTFHSPADQRRLERVRAARRQREASRAQRDAFAGLDLGSPRGAVPSTSTRSSSGDEARGTDLALDPIAGTAPAASGDGRPDLFTILVVCTGNVCRSPYFERVLAADLADLPVSIEGAGTGALLIDRMASGSQELLRHRGLDGAGYVPRQLAPGMVRGADLVLTATREHRRAVVDELPVAAPRVFALLDFADACRSTDLGAWRGVDGLRAFVEETPAGSVQRRSARSEEDAAIIDPFRQGPQVFEAMAAQADPALATVADAVRAILTHA